MGHFWEGKIYGEFSFFKNEVDFRFLIYFFRGKNIFLLHYIIFGGFYLSRVVNFGGEEIYRVVIRGGDSCEGISTLSNSS